MTSQTLVNYDKRDRKQWSRQVMDDDVSLRRLIEQHVHK